MRKRHLLPRGAEHRVGGPLTPTQEGMGSFISIRIPGVTARGQVFPRTDGGITGRGGGPVELAAPAFLSASTISAGPTRWPPT